MSRHHKAITAAIKACGDVSELLDIAETCIRTSRLLHNGDPDEATAYHRHVLHAMECVRLLSIAGRAAP